MRISSETDPRVIVTPGHLPPEAAREVARTVGLPADGPHRVLGESIVFANRRGSTAPRDRTARERPAVPAVLVVVEQGPDAGLVRRLPRGRSLVGRGSHRLQLQDPAVSRDHLTVDVANDGVRVTALPPARLRVNGRSCADAMVDERHDVVVGQDHLRILGTRRELPSAPRTWDEIRTEGPRPPGRPWVHLIGAIAPMAAGGLVAWLTGQWLLLAFGAVGLFTGGSSALMILRDRRRFRRRCAREATDHAAAVVAAYPGTGSWLVAWGDRAQSDSASRANPGTMGRRADPTRVAAAPIGRCLEPKVRVRTGSELVADIPVPALPALCAPAPGERVWLVGRGEAAAAVARAIVLTWANSALSGRGMLQVARSSWLPARLLALPGVDLASEEATPRGVDGSGDTSSSSTHGTGPLARFLPSGDAAPVEVRVLDRGDGGTGRQDDWVVDVERGVIRRPGTTVPFLPGGPSLRGADEAVAAALTRPAERGHEPTAAVGAMERPDHFAGPSAAPDRLLAGKASDNGAVSVRLGTGEHCPVTLDLVRDGPHLLVAGTTGSGKSELLRVLLTGLVMTHSPTRLRLVLFDFKGGSTFDPFATLPHVEALVTDLDAAAAVRVIDSLEAELSRRERRLRAHGVADLAALPAELAPARIVLAVDEFREVAERAPAVLARLVHLATVGRSLGLHLVLATQRPQGVVSADIRANVSTTLCLRLTSETESLDLLGTPDAARISADRPGSALLRRAGEPAIGFQVDPTHASGEPIRARVIGPTCASEDRVEIAAGSDVGWERRLAALATTSGSPPDPFIAPELPSSLRRVAVRGLRAHVAAEVLPLGLMATPARLLPLVHVPSEDGMLAVLGSGVVLARVLGSWLVEASRSTLADNSVVLDGLDAVPSQCQVGLCVTPDDAATADEALEAMARSRSPGPGPAVLWLLGPSAWFGDGTDPAGLRREALVARWVSAGGAAVVAGDRDLAASRLLAHAARRLYLPHGVAPETRRLWPRIRDDVRGPGRAVLMEPEAPEGGRLVHCTSLPALSDSPRASTDASRGHGTHRRADSASTALRHDAGWGPPPQALRATSAHSGALAVGGLDHAPVRWSPRGALGLVLGSAGSGRTTVLNRLLEVLDGGCRFVPAEAALPSPDDAEGRWWLVDDVETRTRAELAVLAERARSSQGLIVAARSGPRVPAAVSWWHLLDPHGGVILLGPSSRSDADAVGWRIPAAPTAPPGRGWLVPATGVEPARVQCLLPQQGGRGTMLNDD